MKLNPKRATSFGNIRERLTKTERHAALELDIEITILMRNGRELGSTTRDTAFLYELTLRMATLLSMNSLMVTREVKRAITLRK